MSTTIGVSGDIEKLKNDVSTPDLINAVRNAHKFRSDGDACLVMEVCRRLEIVSKFDVAFTVVNAAQALLENLEETHAALCFTPDYIGSLRYEQNKAAIEAAKGI